MDLNLYQIEIWSSKYNLNSETNYESMDQHSILTSRLNLTHLAFDLGLKLYVTVVELPLNFPMVTLFKLKIRGGNCNF